MNRIPFFIDSPANIKSVQIFFFIRMVVDVHPRVRIQNIISPSSAFIYGVRFQEGSGKGYMFF